MRFNLTEEELMIQKLARDFTCSEIEPLAAQVEKTNRTPRSILKKLADVRLLGIALPKEFGGAGASVLADTLVVEEIAKAGTGIEWLVSMNNSIADSINHYASENIKRRFLPPVCQGEKCLSIMFTEPSTGSDPKMIATKAELKGKYYLVKGEKRFISWADWPGYATLYAKDETGNISCLIIEKKRKGYSTGGLYKKIGGHAQESMDVYFEDMKVPAANLVGAKGKGFTMLLWWIAAEKIQQSAAALGIAEAAFEESLTYTKSRKLRNSCVADLQGVQWMLSDMKTKIEAMRWLIYKCACLRDEQASNWINMAALCKTFAIPTATEVTLSGLRLHSAYGFTKDFKIGRLHQSVLGGLGVATSIEVNQSIIGASLVR